MRKAFIGLCWARKITQSLVQVTSSTVPRPLKKADKKCGLCVSAQQHAQVAQMRTECERLKEENKRLKEEKKLSRTSSKRRRKRQRKRREFLCTHTHRHTQTEKSIPDGGGESKDKDRKLKDGDHPFVTSARGQWIPCDVEKWSRPLYATENASMEWTGDGIFFELDFPVIPRYKSTIKTGRQLGKHRFAGKRIKGYTDNNDTVTFSFENTDHLTLNCTYWGNSYWMRNPDPSGKRTCNTFNAKPLSIYEGSWIPCDVEKWSRPLFATENASMEWTGDGIFELDFPVIPRYKSTEPSAWEASLCGQTNQRVHR